MRPVRKAGGKNIALEKNIERKYRILSLFLCAVLAIVQISDIGYALNIADAEENIVEKTKDTTTYDLGEGKYETVFYSEDIRFEDEKGNLTDYDPGIVEIRESKTQQNADLEGYAYENKAGDHTLD